MQSNSLLIAFLHGFSQIMLQENVFTGIFFIIGIGIHSPIMLFGAAIAAVSSLLLAKYLKYDSEEINKGLYGYNAALVGCAILYFMKPSLLSFTLIILGAFVSALIMNFMLKKVRRVFNYCAALHTQAC